jgi:hypothetical protein
MRKTLFLAALLIAATSLAAPVSPEKALYAAKEFLSQHHIGVTLKSQPVNLSKRLMGSQSQPDYYVFNTDANRGFVIVSADSRTTSILGYADNGSFDPANVPVNMQKWLEGYS